MLCVSALLDCFCCLSEVGIEGVLFSTVLARGVLGKKDVKGRGALQHVKIVGFFATHVH